VQAWECLSDPIKRKTYDSNGKKEQQLSPRTAAAVERWRAEMLVELYSMLQNMVLSNLPFQ
jgi:DnaJ-class molecular chaperone